MLKLLVLSSFGLFFIVGQCDKTNPVEPGVQRLNVTESVVEIAKNFGYSVSISGGSGSYMIKSISDSNIVDAFAMHSNFSPKYISFLAKNLGTAKVIVQDSAKKAEVEIVVVVKMLVSNPSVLKIRVRRSRSLQIYGGTSPYTVTSYPNSAFAEIDTISSGISYFNLNGIAVGTTSMTVKDNSNPANFLIIPITVEAEPVFTQAGKITFNSDKGNVDIEGIIPGGFNGLINISNNEGAGGFILFSSPSFGSSMLMAGYTKRGDGLYDIVSLVMDGGSIAPQQVAFDTGYVWEGPQTVQGRGTVAFGINPNSSTENGSIYRLHSGSLNFTTLTETKAIGTFSGTGTRRINNIPVPGQTVTVTGGSFNVQIITDDFFSSAEMEKQGPIIKKLLRNEFEKLQKQFRLERKK